MRYQALFLDIDDTLIHNSRPVSSENLAAIRRAQAAGIFVTVATGRNYLGASSIWKALKVEGPVIVYGGAMAVDTRTDEILFVESVPPALVHEALLYAKDLHVHAQLYIGNSVISGEENEFTRQYTSYQNLPFILAEDILLREWENIPKILVYVDPSMEEEYHALFAERFKNRLEVASSKPGFIELNSLGHNKGTALIRVAAHLGIPQEATASMGDNTLDLGLLSMAGLGACVENGHPLAKEAADMIVPAAGDHGVAWFIDHCMLGGA